LALTRPILFQIQIQFISAFLHANLFIVQDALNKVGFNLMSSALIQSIFPYGELIIYYIQRNYPLQAAGEQILLKTCRFLTDYPANLHRIISIASPN
jgi:hypothetical protein